MIPISVRNGAIVLALLLPACASPVFLTEDQCRGTNWYQRGEQEALMGMRPQIDLYAQQCSKFGAAPSEKDYMDGWAYGYGEWNRRVSGRRG
ncbi:MAG TPA: DUF2799 domain-containing protein [Burkholderiales bacterium]|nr:DUF2799 domain-containing protein [Burkholderiales bacterium]